MSDEATGTRRAAGIRDRARRVTASSRELMHTRFPVARRIAHEFRTVRIFDTAITAAAQAFLTAVPALFVVAAFSPEGVRNEVLQSLQTIFGLRGQILDQFQEVYGADSESVRQTFGILGIAVTLLSATALSRALQRLCERAWQVPHTTARVATWRWLAWLAGWLAALATLGTVRGGFGAGPILGVPLTLLAVVALWWWTQRLLLARQVPWLPLLPGAVLTALAMALLAWVSPIYMPRALNESIDQFGPLGSVFTLLSWLIVIFASITVSIALGHIIATEPPLNRYLTRHPPPTPSPHPVPEHQGPPDTD
ncbi:YhjD/YihY/BrkB family envelope integrity protein [Streptomyces sp. NPDC051940]|uniref:YhjD/YihY/BrkB family envelope integrity protein n=1 Tax=Streptomyces sp. NPDC051940 TaxID=3155675 RepID=UPI003436033A